MILLGNFLLVKLNLWLDDPIFQFNSMHCVNLFIDIINIFLSGGIFIYTIMNICVFARARARVCVCVCTYARARVLLSVTLSGKSY